MRRRILVSLFSPLSAMVLSTATALTSLANSLKSGERFHSVLGLSIESCKCTVVYNSVVLFNSLQ